MRQKGSITVFLSLILVCVSALIFALLESARTAGARYYLQTAADAAMDSLYSNFHKELWENYRLILYEGVDEQTVEKDYMRYVKDYIDNSNIYRLDEPKAEVMDLRRITDDSAFWFEKELTEYMKYNLVDFSGSVESFEEAKKDVEQANIIRNITVAYGGHTKEAVKVEKSLMRITESLNNISSAKAELEAYIAAQDEEGCRASLMTIESEADSLSDKLKLYEEAADNFEESLSNTESELKEEWEKLTSENKELFEEGTGDYRNYSTKDKERRTEVITKVEAAKENSQNMAERYELIDSIAELDADEDADEIDDKWGILELSCNDISTPVIDSAHGIADENREESLESMMDFLSGDIISLVLPSDRYLSLGSVDKSSFPSSLTNNISAKESDPVDNLLLNEYSARFFADFSDNADKEFAYELEYIYAGFDTDKANLSATLTDILALRTGLNYTHILSDSEKMEQVSNLALTIAGRAGFPKLSVLISFLIISVWSLAESVADIKALLNKEKVAFFKTKEDWRLGLDSLMNSPKSVLDDMDKKESGLDYESYIKSLLLMIDSNLRDYRMMDMMQNNISGKEADFKMESMIYASKIKVYAKSYRVFSSLSIGGTELISLSPSYKLYTEAIGAY
jgi:hypothetical protein